MIPFNRPKNLRNEYGLRFFFFAKSKKLQSEFVIHLERKLMIHIFIKIILIYAYNILFDFIIVLG